MDTKAIYMTYMYTKGTMGCMRKSSQLIFLAGTIPILGMIYLVSPLARFGRSFAETDHHIHSHRTINSEDSRATASTDLFDSKTQRLNMDYPWLSHPTLPRRVSLEEYKEYLRVLRDFVSLMNAADVTYAMFYGTLLGSYRMHNMVPWDTDIDIIVKYDDIFKVFDSIQQLSKEGRYRALIKYLNFQTSRIHDRMYFQDINRQNLTEENLFYHFVFFPTNGTAFGKYKFPYIDVSLFKENTTHVWGLDGPQTIHMKREMFYPLSSRPFGNMWLPSPRDANYSLRAQYGNFENDCRISPWIKGRRVQKARMKCDELHQYYPWVTRQSYPSYTEERLMYKDTLIHAVIIH